MGTPDPEKQNLLYLEQITLQDVPNREYTLRLFVENVERDLERKGNHAWIPAQRQNVFPTSQIRVEARMKSGHSFWAKYRQANQAIDLHGLFSDFWSSNNHEFTVKKDAVIGKHSGHLEVRFSANDDVEALRSSLHELEGLLKEYSPLMTGSIGKSVEWAVKYGAVFAELNPISKALFGVASVTVELLKEQSKYDEIPSGLFNRVQRILPLVKQVADEIVSDETKILKELIPRMFDVMHRVAKISCDYVRRAKTIGGSEFKEMLDAMDKELNNIIEDFDRAVYVEALRIANETKRAEQERVERERLERIERTLLKQERVGQERLERERVEQERTEKEQEEQERVELKRLKPVETGYHRKFRCMDGTRQSLLNHITDWVANKSGQEDVQPSNTYWLYGSPGIGKTSLAHSICASLHEQNHLAGAFFCRRDDPNLSEPMNVLPTFIHKLAILFPPFRTIVAKHLHDDPNFSPQSMKTSLFLDFIRSLPHSPEHSLVLVIDALDECGDAQSRPRLLKVLSDAATQAPWLRIIITSRTEVDIQRFFNSLTKSSYLSYDLATDQDANTDLRTFARSQFDLVAEVWHFDLPWPNESDFNRVISRANGLFIFIKTLVLALETHEDPEESLKEALQDSAGTGLESLYALYSSILKIQIVHKKAEFQRMIGVLLAASPYRALCDETIAELAGLKPNLVKKWVDALNSLLYRDEAARKGIRVRHLSVLDFLVSDHCNHQVNIRDADVLLGIDCLRVMTTQLRFNICKLEDSRFANADIGDLPSRMMENISDPLQYSCLHWSNHLSFPSDNHDQCALVLGGLKKFLEGLYPLFWMEVLSIMGMVPVGAPSIRRLLSRVRGADPTLLERIQDIGHFLITFHTAISFSTPHIYISTQPFLPSQSPLSKMFSKEFTRAIKIRVGKLSSWPASPLEWTGHTGSIKSVCYSLDGTRVVSGSDDKTIRIWDAKSGTVIGEPLTGHTGGVTSFAYSPNGRHIISGSSDRTIRTWDVETATSVGDPLEGHTDWVRSVAYSPDGRHIISGSDDRTIRIWDVETGTAVGNPLEGHAGAVWSVDCSPDGRHIISGSSDRTIIIWDAKTGTAVGNPLEGHAGMVLSIAYSPDGRNIISGSSDRTIRIWDAKSGTAVGNPLEGADWVRSVVYSPDGRYIVSGSDDSTIRIWDAETGTAVERPLQGHAGAVVSLAYSPDGRYIISGSDDHAMRNWDAETGAAIGNPLGGHAGVVLSIAHSPDGRHITSGSEDRTIRIWDAETGAAVGGPLEGHTDWVRSVAYSPDGRRIISGSIDNTIRIWDAETGTAVGDPLEGHAGWVQSVAYSPNGQHIISGSADCTIRTWDAETGSAVGNPIEGHRGAVSSVAYSPDGRHITSGSDDLTVRIWNAETGAAVGKPFEGHAGSVVSVAYSRDGRHIVSGSSDSTVRIWDAETGAVNLLEGHTDWLRTVAYSHDGRYIISGSDDCTIRIWDAEAGAAVGNPLKGHTSWVQSVAYSPNGRHILSGSSDRTIRIWNAESGPAALKGHAGLVTSGSSDTTTRVRDPSLHVPIPLSCNPNHPEFCAKPDASGWVRDEEGGLLYWVPHDIRAVLHSPALLTIPLTARNRSVSLDFDDFAFGTAWPQIFISASS